MASRSLSSGRRGGDGRGRVVSRREGGVQVADLQRARMLRSAAEVIAEHGYEQMTVARVAGGARVSRRTFYDMFEDREDCFLAVFDDAIVQARRLVIGAWEAEKGWREQVRETLTVLLGFFDRDPRIARLLIVDALKAGPRVLDRRARLLDEVSGLLQELAERGRLIRRVPPLTGEGVIGAVLGVIHTRLSQKKRGSLIELVGPLMGIIVLPYQGPAAAQRELERPTPSSPHAAGAHELKPMGDPLAGLQMRITYRTLRVLSVIASKPGTSNRQIAEGAGVSDQGQISKLLARLERLGLVQNAVVTVDHRAQPTGEPNAWRLTSRGQEVARQPRCPQQSGEKVETRDASR
jgi:AcrR family transcriptional regulator/DNA-binding MarR family transcriptional regulator